MARAVNVDLTLDDFQRISDKTPFLADLKPSGKYVMEDMQRYGGTPAVMRMLLDNGRWWSIFLILSLYLSIVSFSHCLQLLSIFSRYCHYTHFLCSLLTHYHSSIPHPILHPHPIPFFLFISLTLPCPLLPPPPLVSLRHDSW